MRSVLLIDDHPVVALGLDLAIRNCQRFEFAGSIADPVGGLAHLAAVKPDGLVLDLVFDGIVHLSLVAQCRAALPSAVIIIFSSLPRKIYAAQAIAAGADDFLGKAADMPTLLARFDALFSRKAGSTREAETELPHKVPPPLVYGDVYLTARETEVALRLGRGLSIALIALEIGISANTVAAHRDNIRKKLGCRDTKDLVARLASLDGGGNGQA